MKRRFQIWEFWPKLVVVKIREMHVAYVYPRENITRVCVYEYVTFRLENKGSDGAFVQMEVASWRKKCWVYY
jgi:hypothetical protein